MDYEALNKMTTPRPWQIVVEHLPIRVGSGESTVESTRIFTARDHPQLEGPAPVVNIGMSLPVEGECLVHSIHIRKADAAFLIRACNRYDHLKAIEQAARHFNTAAKPGEQEQAILEIRDTLLAYDKSVTDQRIMEVQKGMNLGGGLEEADLIPEPIEAKHSAETVIAELRRKLHDESEWRKVWEQQAANAQESHQEAMKENTELKRQLAEAKDAHTQRASVWIQQIEKLRGDEAQQRFRAEKAEAERDKDREDAVDLATELRRNTLEPYIPDFVRKRIDDVLNAHDSKYRTQGQKPQGTQVAKEAQRQLAALQSAWNKAEVVGAQMSNVCFNLAQQKDIPPRHRKIMEELRQRWDEVKQEIKELSQ